MLSEKPLAKIKVTEICRDADINRSTYYSHFSNPADQLNALENQILSELDAFLDSFLLIDCSMAREQYYVLKHTFDYIYDNKKTLKTLLFHGGDTEFAFRLFRSAAKHVFGASQKETVKHYEFIFASMGCFGIIQYWILSENDAGSDDIAQIITTLLQKLNAP